MKKISKILWGIVLIAVGVIFALNAYPAFTLCCAYCRTSESVISLSVISVKSNGFPARLINSTVYVWLSPFLF